MSESLYSVSVGACVLTKKLIIQCLRLMFCLLYFHFKLYRDKYSITLDLCDWCYLTFYTELKLSDFEKCKSFGVLLGNFSINAKFITSKILAILAQKRTSSLMFELAYALIACVEQWARRKFEEQNSQLEVQLIADLINKRTSLYLNELNASFYSSIQ